MLVPYSIFICFLTLSSFTDPLVEVGRVPDDEGNLIPHEPYEIEENNNSLTNKENYLPLSPSKRKMPPYW